MRIVVQLTPEAARTLRNPPSQRPRSPVVAWLERPLVPVHSRTADRSLERFYEISVDNRDEASSLLERLRNDPSVEGAYLKPEDELP